MGFLRHARAIGASMDWRMASARPMVLSAASRLIAPVISLTVVSETTSQCETSSARLGVEEGAGEAR